MKRPFPLLAAAMIATGAMAPSLPAQTDPNRPNILLLTTDDMNYDSFGFMNPELKDATPHMDRLAAAGHVFERGHIVTPICGPSRAAIHTGVYPHKSGSLGHGPMPPADWEGPVASHSLSTLLHDAGYLTGLFNKGSGNGTPARFDVGGDTATLDRGRNPYTFHRVSSEFFARAKEEGKPFFLNANTHDPHRPWPRTEQERLWVISENERARERLGDDAVIHFPDPPTEFGPNDYPLPAFLPDLPEVREFFAPYFDGVRRADDSMAAILQALEESGLADNTLIILLSDHGAGVAGAKWSLYPYGTQTPIVFHWPGQIEGGTVDPATLVSTVDLLPTIMDAVGLPIPGEADGRSLLPLLTGGGMENGPRDYVYTSFNYMNYSTPEDNTYLPLRSVISDEYIYIWNPWRAHHDRVPNTVGGNEETIRMMEDSGIERYIERAHFLRHRADEEFYHIGNDPGCWDNLIDDPGLQDRIGEHRAALLRIMEDTGDHETKAFRALHGAP